MANYRGLLWSLVAIAGTATAVTVAYRYATRSARPSDVELDAETAQRRRDGTLPSHDNAEADADAAVGNADDYELLSDAEHDGIAEELADAVQNEEQQLALVTREGNAMLSMMGLIMIVIVSLMGAVVAWTREDAASPLDLPMFQPLLWMALGVFTAATVEVLSASTVTTAPDEIPVLSEKVVFPHEPSDFDMIERYQTGDRDLNGDNAHADQIPTSQARGAARAIDNGEEEKSDSPSSHPPTCDVESFVAQAEELFTQNKHAEAYALLKTAIAAYPTEIELLWRLARACNYLIDETSGLEQKKALATEGLSYADTCMATNPNVAASYKWKGIMTGAVGNFRDLKAKLAGAYVIRDYIQRAIELDPADATCHNILGQWCLAFADMSWIEKRAAATLFGTPPTATYDQALGYFLTAENISPGFWKKNGFLVAQTYYKMGQQDKSREWVRKAKRVPVKTKEDADVEKEIAALMKKLAM